MRIIITLLSAMLALNGLSEVKIEDTQTSGLPAKIISNEVISFVVVPSANGRISSLRLLPDGPQLLNEYEETTSSFDPLLPPMTSSNNGGYKEWFFRRKERNISNSSMVVRKQETTGDKAVLELYSKGYMGSPLSMEKTYILNANAGEIIIKIKLKNTGKKTETAALWINNIPKTEREADYNLLPVAGNSPFAGQFSTLTGDRDEIRRLPCKTSHNDFFAPAQPWFVRYFKQLNLALAISVANPQDLRPGGMLYTWQGIIKSQQVTTQEMILAPVKLAPQQEKSYEFKIMLFKDMPVINAIVGNTAIRFDEKQKEAVLTLSSACKRPALTLKTTAGKTTEIPAAARWKKTEVILPGNASDLYGKTLYLADQEFTILPYQKSGDNIKK